MKKTDLSRRDFNRLSMAAFSGVLAGSLAGCAKTETPESGSATTGTETPAATEGGETAAAAAPDENVSLLLQEPHVCRGLNSCKSDKNECAGTGACATVAAHECAGNNECKGQGGCASDPGQNACKGKGSCKVPLMDSAWTKARKGFEEAMTGADKKFGEAPAKS